MYSMELISTLRSHGVDDSLVSVIQSVADACREIRGFVARDRGDQAGTENVYGESQLALDVRADGVLINYMEENEHVVVVGSEELDDEKPVGDSGEYAVCFDPLDGSSLADVNLSVGTIVSIYKKNSFIGTTGDDLVAALYVLYGPRTTMMISWGSGTREFILEQNNWQTLREKLTVSADGKMFAPGNLSAAAEVEGYFKLLEYWVKNGYKLRYSGGMVPDVNQILVKGKGIFMYPASSKVPEGKLRLLFECRPMAYLIEHAGGAASNGKKRILDIPLADMAQTSPIILGSSNEVQRAEEMIS